MTGGRILCIRPGGRPRFANESKGDRQAGERRRVLKHGKRVRIRPPTGNRRGRPRKLPTACRYYLHKNNYLTLGQ